MVRPILYRLADCPNSSLCRRLFLPPLLSPLLRDVPFVSSEFPTPSCAAFPLQFVRTDQQLSFSSSFRTGASYQPLGFPQESSLGGTKQPGVKSKKRDISAQFAPGASFPAQMADLMESEDFFHQAVTEERRPGDPSGAKDDVSRLSPAIGIDLGTSYSRVAVWHEGEIKLVPLDENNNTEIPSCVGLGGSPDDSPGENILIGWPAFQLLPQGRAIHRARRIVGRVDTDESLQLGARFWPFLVQLPGIGIRPVIALKKGDRWESVNAEEVLALQLHYLRRAAERFLGRDVSDAVLTSPAAFTRFQCGRLAAAAAAAGLRVRRIVAEPNAVGLLYAAQEKQRESARRKGTGRSEAAGGAGKSDRGKGTGAPGEQKESGRGKETEGPKSDEKESEDKEKNVLVFHLGSGYCSVGIVCIDDGVSQSRAIAGAAFGTDDFVNNLVARALTDPRTRAPAPDAPTDRKTLFWLWQTYREAMVQLSESEFVDLPEDPALGKTLSRAEFEESNEGLFRACVDMVTRCLADARLKPREVQEVHLLGGGVRINKLEVRKGREYDDELVKGAALEAAIAGGVPGVDTGLLLLQGINHPLGIKVEGDVFQPILSRNALIPTSRELIFTTIKDNQEQAIIQFYEGEQPVVEQNVFLGCLQVAPLPRARAGFPKIIVCLDVDAGDALRAHARVEMPPGDYEDPPGPLPEPLVVKLPSVDVGHGWCKEALRIKYGTSADVRLYETAPTGVRKKDA
ncbi:heat-shock protein 70T-2 [Klebsormidium nitens]|uniref:Heat-shock protein 70T-2 n=1 Tax=Klebsormidium nitens TaxID=105231 RepID=A0A1Y1IJJ9_KLENI|nr:heat-shock protein 70T-2 [Klebsormidium nitens]|eukprot:GAQ90883.1 heat-shock protein 70T-2 [Klebsormidium nitens]